MFPLFSSWLEIIKVKHEVIGTVCVPVCRLSWWLMHFCREWGQWGSWDWDWIFFPFLICSESGWARPSQHTSQGPHWLVGHWETLPKVRSRSEGGASKQPSTLNCAPTNQPNKPKPPPPSLHLHQSERTQWVCRYACCHRVGMRRPGFSIGMAPAAPALHEHSNLTTRLSPVGRKKW